MRTRSSGRREGSPCERSSNIRAVQLVLLSLALSCGHGRALPPPIENTSRKQDTLQIVVGHPLTSGDALLSLSLLPGQQESRVIERCGKVADDQAWKAALERAGYVAEIWNMIVDTRDGRIHALRFRKGAIFGDLVIEPGINKPECQMHTFRLQYSSLGDGKPEAWRSKFLLGGLRPDPPPSDLYGIRARYFNPSKDFPPGYP